MFSLLDAVYIVGDLLRNQQVRVAHVPRLNLRLVEHLSEDHFAAVLDRVLRIDSVLLF